MSDLSPACDAPSCIGGECSYDCERYVKHLEWCKEEYFDRIETLTREKAALEDQIDALVAKVQSLSAHDGCACSFDRPDDICDHHSPKLAALRREALDVVKQLLDDKNTTYAVRAQRARAFVEKHAPAATSEDK